MALASFWYKMLFIAWNWWQLCGYAYCNEILPWQIDNSFLGSQPRMVIWGTDVVVEDCREKFSRFLKTYKCSEFDSQGNISSSITFLLTDHSRTSRYCCRPALLSSKARRTSISNTFTLAWFGLRTLEGIWSSVLPTIDKLSVWINSDFRHGNKWAFLQYHQ